MKLKHQKKPKKLKELALERIRILFDRAEEEFKEDAKLSNRYVSLARKIAMKYKVKMPRELKRSYCKHCLSYLKPGANCRVRVQRGKVIYYCLNCKKFMRIPYTREKKSK